MRFILRTTLALFLTVMAAGQTPAKVSFVARMDFPTGLDPVSTATADLNADGKLDIVTVNFQSNDVSVLLGNGDGTFQSAESYPVDVAPFLVMVADINGDGIPDVLTANEGNNYPTCFVCSVSVLLGNGDGTFQAQKLINILGQQRDVIAIADFNGDGNLDLAFPIAVPQVGESALAVMLGNGDGTFQSQITANAGPFAEPPYMIAADFNGDGKLDLAITVVIPGGVSVFLGNGDGTFQAPKTTTLNVGVAPFVVSDFTGDGKLDFAFVGGSDTWVLQGNGDGTFQTTPILSDGVMDAGFPIGADLNGDGILDLVVPNVLDSSSGTEVLLGLGGGKFQPPINLALPSVGPYGTPSTAVGDFDGDGELDLASVSGGVSNLPANVSVALGYGDGTFQLDTFINVTTGLLATNDSILIGDFNGDGKPDLLAVLEFLQVGGEFGVLLGNGDGTFQKMQLSDSDPCVATQGGSGPCQAASGDLNGDGKLDVAITSGGIVGVFLGNGDGTFQTEVNYGGGGNSIALGDFNGDGHLDAVTTGGSNNNISLLLGNGDGTFGFPTTISTNGPANFVAVGDFNHDGKLDLAIATGTNIAIFLGNGDGTFGAEVDYPVLGCVWAVVADFNGDGKLDLATANSAAGVSVLLGNGDGTFGVATNYPVLGNAYSIASADFNGDGKVDLAVGTGDVSVLVGNGDGTFQPSVSFGTQSHGTQVVSADFNGDGSPDIAVPGISLLFNRLGLKAFLRLKNSGPTSITVAAGKTATYTLAIGGGGFAGTATLTCSGAPAGATCSLPSSMNVSATTPSPFTVTVTTTARSSAAVMPNAFHHSRWLWTVALAGILILPGSSKRQRLNVARCLPILLVLFIASCGGGGSGGSGGGGSNGTPAGNYTITVKATAGSLTQSLPVTLIVQ